MKRLIVQFALLVVLAGGSGANGSVLFEDDFDDATPGKWPPKWSKDLAARGATALVDDGVYISGKSLHVSDSGSSVRGKHAFCK